MVAGLRGVTDVSLVYKRYQPTGKGLLTFSTPENLREALQAAKKITFTGREKITASITVDPQLSTGQRLRGVRGRADASHRGLLGSGPSAGFPAGRTVTVVGFPGKMTVEKFLPLVKGFQLALDKKSVVQVPLSKQMFTMFARFVVMLASESEAQRLVRKIHCTPFYFGRVTRNVKATVIY